jgi:thiol:disulfide interchange protein DsbD
MIRAGHRQAPGTQQAAAPRSGAGRGAVSLLACVLGGLLCLALPGPQLAAQPALGGAAPQLLGGPAEQIEFLPVEEAYPLGVEVEGERELRLVWQMPPGYYLYQHAFRFALEYEGLSRDLEPSFPPAITREDEYFGVVQVYYDSLELMLQTDVPVAGSTLTVTSQGCADAGLCYPPRTQRFAIDNRGSATEIAAAPPRRSTGVNAAGAGAAADPALLASMLLFAFLGGLILNLMPCVFPILSLKVLGFARAEPQERHHHGWLYSAGVVTSFVAVAALLMSLRGAGQAVGWGFQLQSPGFVTALAYLFTVMGLSLSGVVHIGGGLMNLGSGLASRGGASGSFFTGVLAVVVASPCTAPFMGSALGFALTQPATVGLAVFAALGAGMALPLLLLSYSEWARQRLPRPGPWMETLQQVLAFPLYATALWLFWVAGRQLGVDFMAAALLGALLLALALWLWRDRWPGRAAALGCVVAALLLASWRPAVAPGEDGLPAGSIAYSPARLAQLRAAGDAVFVDVTADWCITCLANERAVLSREEVQRAFRERGVTYMVADWTDYDPDIADFVGSHGRSGIPLYVLYGGGEPRILPQILRSETLLRALADAAPGARVAPTPSGG